MIQQATIEQIKSATDIVSVASDLGIELKRSGRTYVGMCPFHDNKNTPAFAVFPDTGTWRCFGACGTGGDAISLVQKKKGFDFKEAVAFLGGVVGVAIEQGEERFQREKAALRAATNLYQEALAKSQETLAYLSGRGLQERTIAEFRLGYAPMGDICLNELPQLGYEVPFLIEAGLVVLRKDGTLHDRFRDRLIIPIMKGSDVVGFGARADRQPKYINSPASPWFNKSQLLFGLNKVVKGEPIVVVEGYFDVMTVWQNGGAAVAPMGTALTHEQATTIGRSFPKVTFAFDGDEAGRKATVRGIEAGRNAFPRATGIAPYGRGRMTTTTYLQTAMYVAPMPEKQDPDSLIRSNPEAWQEALAHPTHAIDWMIADRVRGKDLTDVAEKEAIALEIMPLIQTMSPMQYEHWLSRLGVALNESTHVLAKLGVGGASLPVVPKEDAPQLGQMEYVVALILSNPSLLPSVNALLVEHDHLEVTADDFPQYADKLLVGAIQDDPHLMIADGWKVLEDEAIARAEYVLSQQWQPIPPDRMAYFVAIKIIEWRMAITQQAITQLRTLLSL